jgi:sugar/nucleoside kinase (ribokinase family)
MAKKEFDVLVAGELNVDLILDGISAFPQKGKEILAEKSILTLGSSSAIFASNLSVLESKVCFAGKIGRDPFGEKVIKSLAEKRVSTKFLMYSRSSNTGVTVALSYGNERAMVTYPGAMKELSEKDITDEMIQSSRHLHVSSIFLQPSLKKGITKLFQRAKGWGLTISLDPQWDPEEKWDCNWEQLLPLVDVFMPNKEEIMRITGRDNTESCIEAVNSFSNIIVVKEGTEGAVGYERGKMIKQRAYLNPEVVDTIGAGDSFNAGFIHHFINNKPLKGCLELGSVCGAINTTASGGTSAFSAKENIKLTALNKFKYIWNDL